MNSGEAGERGQLVVMARGGGITGTDTVNAVNARVDALREVSIEVYHGQVVCLLCPSGSIDNRLDRIFYLRDGGLDVVDEREFVEAPQHV